MNMFPGRDGSGFKSRRAFALVTRILITAVAVVASISLFEAASSAALASDGSAPVVPVQTTNPKRQDVPVYLSGLGIVRSENTINITTRVDGQLQSVSFVEGQHVKKGDLLAVIDPRPFQDALNQATAKIAQDQANLASARFLLQKDNKLAGQQIVTQEAQEQQQGQVDSLMAQLAQDQAAKDSAQVSLSYTEIRSPIDGRTGIRQIDPGNQVTAAGTTPIVTVTQTDPISVISTLRETDLDDVRTSMATGPVAVTASTVDQTAELGSGTILLIDNEIDQATGTIRIKSTFANPDQKLWSGQAVAVKVRQKILSGALTVPSPALQRGPDGSYVYVVDGDGKADMKKVTPGPIESGYAVISTGLTGSEDVVVTGQYRLAPGTKVSSTPFTSLADKE